MFRSMPRPTLTRLVLSVGALGGLLALRARWKRSPAESHFPRMPPQSSSVDGVAVDIYTYGEDLYEAMLEAIEQAEQRIWFENFIWKGDEVGRRFKQALERAAARGVEVYAIFDGFANVVVPREFKHFPATIHALQFRILPPPWRMLNLANYGLDHRKILLVDGKVGFVGGYNIGSVYATSWRDTHVRLSGSVLWELEQACIEFWVMHCDEHLPHLVEGGPAVWDAAVRVKRNIPKLWIFPIRDMYLEAIDRAQHHIYLTFGYFIPDREIRRRLVTAVKRGVDVQVLMPAHSNHPLVDWVARAYIGDLLEGGITILLYRHAMLHAKTATIDGRWSTIGTANIDRLSLAGNYEINVEFTDDGVAQQMEGIFAHDASNAHQLTLQEWEQRPFLAKVGENLLVPLRPLL